MNRQSNEKRASQNLAMRVERFQPEALEHLGRDVPAQLLRQQVQLTAALRLALVHTCRVKSMKYVLCTGSTFRLEEALEQRRQRSLSQHYLMQLNLSRKASGDALL